MLITSVSVGSEAASVPHLILTRVESRDIVAKQRAAFVQTERSDRPEYVTKDLSSGLNCL